MMHAPLTPALAAGLSFLAPGFGQISVGRVRRAIAFAGATALAPGVVLAGAAMGSRGGDLLGLIGGVGLAAAVHLGAAADAWRLAKADRTTSRPSPILLAIVLVVGGVGPLLAAQRLRHEVLAVYRFDGPSMGPTLADGERVVVNLLAAERPPSRDALVLFRSPRDGGPPWIKRVVALPGERVVRRGDGLFVAETRVATALNDSPASQTVPSGTLFVIGDDPERSLDSRSLGPIDAATVIGVIHR